MTHPPMSLIETVAWTMIGALLGFVLHEAADRIVVRRYRAWVRRTFKREPHA